MGLSRTADNVLLYDFFRECLRFLFERAIGQV